MRQLGLESTPQQRQHISQWAALLLRWNQTYNLLGSNDTRVLVEEHLLDSLAILPALSRHLPDPQAPLTDIGSGAGFPGMLIAIAQPERPIQLVEPVGKKAAFLRQSVLTLGLKRVKVFAERIENLQQAEVGGEHPNFICRAFTALDRFAQLCMPFASERSLFFAMKAARIAEEQQALPDCIQVQAVEPIPALCPDIQRFLAVLKRQPLPAGQAPSAADLATGPEPIPNRRRLA